MSGIRCIHCKRPAGVITSRTDSRIVFSLSIGGRRLGVCDTCFHDNVDAAIAAVLAAQAEKYDDVAMIAATNKSPLVEEGSG